MLPFTDELVLLELSGTDLLTVLETGVGSWPALEGRFLQVSGISFAFDGAAPRGARVLPGSVEVAGEPLEPQRKYKVGGWVVWMCVVCWSMVQQAWCVCSTCSK